MDRPCSPTIYAQWTSILVSKQRERLIGESVGARTYSDGDKPTTRPGQSGRSPQSRCSMDSESISISARSFRSARTRHMSPRRLVADLMSRILPVAQQDKPLLDVDVRPLWLA